MEDLRAEQKQMLINAVGMILKHHSPTANLLDYDKAFLEALYDFLIENELLIRRIK